MKIHDVSPHKPGEVLAKPDQLAWKLAAVALDPTPNDADAVDMAINRIIDNAGVAIAAINNRAVANARAQALAHPREGGATVLGVPNDTRVHCEWAAWANATAVRELDFHDYFGGVDSGHPGDNIPSIIAAAEQCACTGDALARGIIIAYETQISMAKGLNIKRHGLENLGNVGPGVAAGIGAMMGLDIETLYEALQQAAHVSQTVRQTRRGDITSWKAYAPGHVGKLAIEAVDRALRGERSPTPIYEGTDGILARQVGGDTGHIPLAEPGEPKTQILETFTKEHSIGYHGQAIVDLAFKMRDQLDNLENIESIVLLTKRNTHNVMGCGGNDPQKYDPDASRETLDHSGMYAFAVALEDGAWHHINSYLPERTHRPETVTLWKKISTVESEEWNKRYDDPPPLERDHGCRAVVTYKDGRQVIDELGVANAHPRGARPFARPEYINKYLTLADGIVEAGESERFLDTVQRLADLKPEEISGLNIALDPGKLEMLTPKRSIF
ncbi:MAG: MmgE/PrpD family protein [Rhodospirillaceae bacterium]|jgi:2-methylcitrate dehydratase